ncbi:YkyA family protein [Virgibacillus sp. NKC19-3]|uniref:YkyA family protein n=1 Tax=Virgibacillus saliphilus TaxID=2831674 RepID=UPI001C9B0310|nr:YkyA family protein [Virgibacillus sp. NKC19-3]MBY7143778.1 YkyA family protein [Virgibacillus sp. NKC19-3]
MRNPLKKSIIVLAISLSIVLAACSGESAEQQLHNHLEEAVSLEEEFEQQQEEIINLEKQEQELYKEIIELDADELDQIQENSQQAINTVDQRSDKIELEKESIDASQEEFNEVSGLIEDLEEETKAKAEEMYQIMENRYSAYNDLYDAYTQSLELERELYSMLQEEDLEQEALSDHINTVNEGYQQVLEANEQFNEYTVEYNALKQEFYELAGLDVEYEENTSAEEGENEEASE